MAFEGAASTVVAQEFVLIDPNGVQVGEFGQDPFGRPGLLFNHNDVLTTDSFLSWTQAGAGTESLFLVGPEGVGQAGQPPSLILSRSPGQKVAALQSVNLVQLIAEASPPDATGTSISINGVSHNVTTVANTETKFDSNGNSRGSGYGLTFFDALLAANVVSNGAQQVILTINIPSGLVTNVIDVSFYATILVNAAVLGTAQIFVDGAPQLPVADVAIAAIGTQITVSASRAFGVTLGVAHTVTLTYAAAAGAHTTIGGNRTGMAIRCWR